MIPIVNANTRSMMPSPQPQMTDTIRGWFTPLSVSTITKSIVNFVLTESSVTKTIGGCLMPYKPEAEDLRITAEGERSWKWYRLFTDTSLTVATDDVVVIDGIRYRVKEKGHWNLNGFYSFKLIEDFTQ